MNEESWYHPDGEERVKRNKISLELLGRGDNGYKTNIEIMQDFRILKLRSLLQLDQFKPRQKNLDDVMKWMAPSDDPLLFIFISHRWEARNTPDPQNQQLGILKLFAGMFLDIAIGSKSSLMERLRRIPTLKTYGALQAAYFVGKIAKFIDDFKGSALELHSILSSRVGIWYDFACLPQKERTTDEEAEFQMSLQNIQRFVTSTPVLALRKKSDDYNKRAWCELEFWSGCRQGNSWYDTVPVLRMDLWGKKLSKDKIEELGPPSNYTSYNSFCDLSRVLNLWESSPCISAVDVMAKIQYNYHLSFSLKDKFLLVPALTRPDFQAHNESDINKTPASFQLWYSIRKLLCLNGLKNVDFGEIIAAYMKENKLRCSDSGDLIPVGLRIIGQHEFWADHGFHTFYGRCLLRYLVEGKDLRVKIFERFPNQSVRFEFVDGEKALE